MKRQKCWSFGECRIPFSVPSLVLYSHVPYRNDTIIKTQEDFFINIFTSHFIVRVRKGFLTPNFMAVNVVSFSFSWGSTGGPGVHSAGCWLSLLHIISIFSGPQLIRAPSPFGLVWLSLPHLVLLLLQLSATQLELQLSWLLSWLSYIIVQRPLDLWNRMFNRHQAEITIMQFRGHSLPVRQSMRVSWDFLACPILLANFSPRDFLS